MRRRHTHRSLAESRIYQRGSKLSLYSAEPLVNPYTGKASKWHVLCRVDEGEAKARAVAAAIREHNLLDGGANDMPKYIREHISALIKIKDKEKPRDPARLKMHEESVKELRRQGEVMAQGFAHFKVAIVLPVDVADFVDQWEGQKMAQVYKARLSKFFKWAIRRGLREQNPCDNVTVEKPPKRKVLITDEQFHAIRDALLIAKDGKRTPSGPMIQCYIDLCYLIFQRTTDIRLLRKTQISEGAIHFLPTKTEHTSGASVSVPITPQIQEVLDRAKRFYSVGSVYVIHTAKGQPFGDSGLRSAWNRAAERAGVEGVTLKDIRPMAMTRAKKLGYATGQLSVAAAHSNERTTEGYFRERDTPVSEVSLSLPPKPSISRNG